MVGTREGWVGLTVALSLLFSLPLPAAGQIRPIELEGFIVTGTPVPRTARSVASHVTVLDGGDLRLRGVARVVDALAEVPGLVVVQGGSYGSATSTFFRGAESDHMKVLVDGVEMNQAGGSFDFSGLLLSDVERIEIVRGPASALYGSDALAGVIHIITRRGKGPLQADISIGGGSYGRWNWDADLHGSKGTSGYSLSAARETTDGILEFNNRFENTVLSGKFFSVWEDKTRIEISGRYSDRTYHFPTDGSGNVVDRNSFTFGREWSLMAEAGRMVSDRIEVVAAVKSYRWLGGSDDRTDGPADTLGYFGYVSDDSFHRTVGDVRMNLAPWTGSVVTFGLELEKESQSSESESFSQWGPSTGKDSYARQNQGYYAHLVSELSGWAGNVGVRLDDNEQYGGFFTYQAGLTYQVPSTGTRFRGNLGRGLKEPTFLEMSSSGFSIGNPDLKPERSRVWELGVEQTFGEGGLTASVTWFRQALEDLIQYTFTTPDPSGPNYFNVAAARTQGVEASLSAPLGGLAISAAYTFMNSEVLDAGFDEGDGAVFVEGEELIRRPNHKGSVRATYAFANARLSGDVRWTGSRSDRDFSAWPSTSVSLPSFTLLGIGGEVDLFMPAGRRPGMTLEVRGENLFDREYQEVYGFDAPGRALFVGFKLDYGGS